MPAWLHTRLGNGRVGLSEAEPVAVVKVGCQNSGLPGSLSSVGHHSNALKTQHDLQYFFSWIWMIRRCMHFQVRVFDIRRKANNVYADFAGMRYFLTRRVWLGICGNHSLSFIHIRVMHHHASSNTAYIARRNLRAQFQAPSTYHFPATIMKPFPYSRRQNESIHDACRIGARDTEGGTQITRVAEAAS